MKRRVRGSQGARQTRGRRRLKASERKPRRAKETKESGSQVDIEYEDKALGEGQGKNTDVDQRLMMKGAADRSVIYHELDFTLKSPIFLNFYA